MQHPSDLRLMRLQTQALYRHNDHNQIVAFNGPPEDRGSAPWVYVGRTPEDSLVRFHPEVPRAFSRQIEALIAQDPMRTQPDKALQCQYDILAILSPYFQTEIVWFGPAFYCPQQPAPLPNQIVPITEAQIAWVEASFPQRIPWLTGRFPCFAAQVDGKAVAIAYCATEWGEAVEVGVETLSSYRQRGYGTLVTSAWINAVHNQGAIPLYSTGWDNWGSRGIAKRLNLHYFGSNFHIRTHPVS